MFKNDLKKAIDLLNNVALNIKKEENKSKHNQVQRFNQQKPTQRFNQQPRFNQTQPQPQHQPQQRFNQTQQKKQPNQQNNNQLIKNNYLENNNRKDCSVNNQPNQPKQKKKRINNLYLNQYNQLTQNTQQNQYFNQYTDNHIHTWKVYNIKINDNTNNKYILIKHDFNESFKRDMEDDVGYWFEKHSGYIFNKNCEEKLIKFLRIKYSNWLMLDLRHISLDI